MYVISPEGVLLYAGGIGDFASTNDDVSIARNSVGKVLNAEFVAGWFR